MDRKKKTKASLSEVHAYLHILRELTEKKGWQKSQILTQGECLRHPEIKKYLVLAKPENVVEINENTFYAIEAKNERRKIDQALSEARDDYAEKINNSTKIKCLFITGIAGNEEEGYIAKSQYFISGRWETITENSIEVTGLLSRLQIEQMLSLHTSNIKDVEITEQEFIKSAEAINEILHQNSINKDYRARFISAILLAMSEGKDIDVSENTTILISSINKRVDLLLKRHGKQDFSNFIKIDEPSNEDNHIKVKEAIVKTYQELLGLNIRSAMRSGKDVLGNFYEVFLKYGNGAKEIGIVLTPRHITKFASEILDINANDLVLDPACGTGGFLVSAYDEVKRKTAKENDFENFKINGLYGIEEQDPVISLAIVNMIFRGDGKTNIIEGNCFKKWLDTKSENGVISGQYLTENKEDRIAPITKVMMNPPFSKPKSDDKEYRFIEQALKQMQDNGILFSVLPTSNMVKQGGYFNWRKESLLRENTLLSVVTFPNDLFYPVGVETCCIIVKKGVPHSKNQNVLWVKVKDDGFLKSKGKRLPNKKTESELVKATDLVKNFIKNSNAEVESIPEFVKACTIDLSDKNLELLPEVYLDEKKPSDAEIHNSLEQTISGVISLMIRFDKIDDFQKNVLEKQSDLFDAVKTKNTKAVWREVPITRIFQSPIKTGFYHKSGALDEGKTPLVSCVSENGGFEGFFDIVDEKNVVENAITIASDGMPLTSFYHFYPFVAKDNVLICKPKDLYKFETFLFITTQLNNLRWRFSYGRKCYENKVHKIKIFLPFSSDGTIAEEYLSALIKGTKNWKILEKILK